MILKKCLSCKKYSLKDSCPKCAKETTSAHYKYNGLRDAPKKFKRV